MRGRTRIDKQAEQMILVTTIPAFYCWAAAPALLQATGLGILPPYGQQPRQ
jgi:hypothetical protein